MHSTHPNLDSHSALLDSLAACAAQVRAAVMRVHETGAISVLLQEAAQIPRSGYEAAVAARKSQTLDAVMTNWTGLGHEHIDFGSGPAMFAGHDGFVPAPVAILPDANGYVMLMTGISPREAQRLAESCILPVLFASHKVYTRPEADYSGDLSKA